MSSDEQTPEPPDDAEAEAPDGETTEDPPDDTAEEEEIGDHGHCVPEAEMYVVRDRNMDYPWVGGNKYARICPECGARQFCAKSYWLQRYRDPERVAHIIKKGEDEPVVAFECVYEGCDGMLVDFPDECPECERAIEWEE